MLPNIAGAAGPFRVRVTAAIAIGVLVTVAAAAQDAQPKPSAFEVATIKLDKSTGFPSWKVQPGGRFVTTRLPLRNLLRLAYGYDSMPRPNEQIVNGPAWIDTDRFTIEAKADHEFTLEIGNVSREAFAMLRTLLEERFALKTHFESRELPVFDLVLARRDGKLGPQLVRSAVDCRQGAPPQPADANCGLRPGPMGLSSRGLPLSSLTALLALSPEVGHIVRDQTGLTGLFDLRLQYTPAMVLGPAGAASNPAADSGLSLFTALQEQLGLKLESKRAPVNVLVIDHIEALKEQ